METPTLGTSLFLEEMIPNEHTRAPPLIEISRSYHHFNATALLCVASVEAASAGVYVFER